MNAELALLPCPFCGNEELTIRSNGIGDYYVICDNDQEDLGGCGARSSDVRCESTDHARERWNRRVALSSPGRVSAPPFAIRLASPGHVLPGRTTVDIEVNGQWILLIEETGDIFCHIIEPANIASRLAAGGKHG